MRTIWILGTLAVLSCATVVIGRQLPGAGAYALLRPSRRPPAGATPAGCVDTAFKGHDVVLRGWRCASTAPRRGVIVYLHGIADNRESAAGLVPKLTARGFDLIAYDSRAHGASGGDDCTYGYFERLDLRRVLDDAGDGPSC